MIKAVLIDDEYYALQGLKMELESIEGIETSGVFEDCAAALEHISGNRPDVVFLDIEMPGMSGLELFQRIIDISENTKIVFITAYSHYAVGAFELNALDYLIKPVQRQRLMKTLERLGLRSEKSSFLEKVKFHCFMMFTIVAGGEELNLKWRTRKSEELLAYLICQEGRFVSKEKIAESLWPEESKQKSLSNLYLSYYLLKQEFEKRGISLNVESKRGKMRISIEDIETDTMEFMDCLEKCEQMNDATIAFAERAAELYRGELLEENYFAWALEPQQRYAILYEELLERIIKYYKVAGNARKCKYYKDKMKSILES